MDKSHAAFHYLKSNEGFHKNETQYRTQLSTKMSKMDKICRITIQKKEQLPILTLNQQVRDKRLQERSDAQVAEKIE